MRVCTFCGCKTDEKVNSCPNCGSTGFLNVCPNCANEFEGAFCPDCGTRYNAIAKVCPDCRTKYFSNACPNCGYNGSSSAKTSNSQTEYRPSTPRQDTRAKANAMTPLILIILGTFTCMFPLTIVGLVLAIRAKNAGDNSQQNRITIVVGLISLAVSVIWTIVSMLTGVLNSVSSS